MAGCFTDRGNAHSIKHDVHARVAQRVDALAPGYEDLDDHDVLRGDSALAVLADKRDARSGGL